MNHGIERLIKENTQLELGVNKLSELSRLVYEIGRREELPYEKILSEEGARRALEGKSKGYLARFAALKKYLLSRRYPDAAAEGGFSAYFSRMKGASTQARTYKGGFVPERIFIEADAEKYPLAKKMRKLYSGRCETISSLKEYRRKNRSSGLDPKKRDIFISVEKWDFIKPCPCTKGVVGCGYHVINLGFGCPYDCSYCYLQQYSNSGGIVLPANISDYLPAIDAYLAGFNGRPVRAGTGEFTDSLALDGLTEYSKILVPYFKNNAAVLELKTKSAEVGNLIGLDHGGRTVISWSLNPSRLTATEELGSAKVEERLAAAAKCLQAGYGVGFHFDPVIHYAGWEKDYRELVDMMFETVLSPEWISIGTLRFHRELKGVIEARFPDSGYIYGELTLGRDRKMRYYDALRKEMFEKMAGWIKKRNPKTLVYLCMESGDMWVSALGKTSAGFFGGKA